MYNKYTYKGGIIMPKHFRLLLIMFIMILMVGCRQYQKSEEQLSDLNTPIVFIAETHHRDDNYVRTFKTSQFESDLVNIGFLKDMLTNDEMATVTGDIYNDIQKINDYLHLGNSNSTLHLYVLDELIDDQIITTNDVVYITIDMIEDDSYYIPLLQAYLDINEPWKLYGLYSLIFEETKDISFLTEYYTNADDISMLGLFGACFNATFNTSEEIEIAMATATSLTAFILDEYDYSMLLNNNTSIMKEEWLHSIGVSKSFSYQYEKEYTNFSFSQSCDYPLIIETDDACYNLIPLEDVLESCKDIEQFIFEDITGRKIIKDYISNNTTKKSDVILEEKHISYYIGDFGISSADSSGVIQLDNRIDQNLHEATHLMIKTSKKWANEGIAEYMSYFIAHDPYACESIYDFLTYFEDEYNDTTENIPDENLDLIVMDYYVKRGGSYESIEDIDVRLFCDASAFVNLNNEWGATSSRQPIYVVYNLSEEERNCGDELSYVQSCSFVAYLIDNYTFEPFLEYCANDGTCEDAFGKSYELLNADWIEYLTPL